MLRNIEYDGPADMRVARNYPLNLYEPIRSRPRHPLDDDLSAMEENLLQVTTENGNFPLDIYDIMAEVAYQNICDAVTLRKASQSMFNSIYMLLNEQGGKSNLCKTLRNNVHAVFTKLLQVIEELESKPVFQFDVGVIGIRFYLLLCRLCLFGRTTIPTRIRHLHN